MKKLIRIYKSLEWLLLLWIVGCFTLAIFNIVGVTSYNWFAIASPLIFVISLPIVMWLIGFITLLVRNLWAWYNMGKAERLAKIVKKDLDKLEKEINDLR